MSFVKKKSITAKLRLSKILKACKFVLFINVDCNDSRLIRKLRRLNIKFHTCSNHVIQKILHCRNHNIKASIKGNVIIIHSGALELMATLKTEASVNCLFFYAEKRFIPLSNKNQASFSSVLQDKDSNYIRLLFYINWLRLIKIIKRR